MPRSFLPLRTVASVVLALGAAFATPAVAQDPVVRLRVVVQRIDRTSRPPEAEEERRVHALVGELRELSRTHPERDAEAADALLDLAALSPPAPFGDVLVAVETRRRLARLGRNELDLRLERDKGGVLARRLAETAAGARTTDADLRIAALDLLAGRHVEATMGGIFAATRSREDAVRNAALAALAGWEDPAIHLFFLERLEREVGPFAPIEAHLTATDGSLGPQAQDRLRGAIGRLYVSGDWRAAARARRLVPFLTSERAVPLLIEALSIWTRRRESESGSRRIELELTDELQRRSGRSIGPFPDRWKLWWNAVQDGRVELLDMDTDVDEVYTEAAFFGLRPNSDRVMFVIDASGSMDGRFGTGRTRYREALEQLLDCVRGLGPDARFGVTLFSDRGRRWRSGLVKANDSGMAAARSWLSSKKPGGATNLRAGLFTSLGAARNGDVQPERLDADTVIVLCDGATDRGPYWVDGWLDRTHEATQLVFHCVQVGGGGDGTLERLAERTGGDFVRVSR